MGQHTIQVASFTSAGGRPCSCELAPAGKSACRTDAASAHQSVASEYRIAASKSADPPSLVIVLARHVVATLKHRVNLRELLMIY